MRLAFISLILCSPALAGAHDVQMENVLDGERQSVTLDDFLVGAAASEEAINILCGGDTRGAVVSTSRAIRADELADCAGNGIVGLEEVLLGYDGLILAQRARDGALSVELRELFLASAALVPEDDTCVLVPNTHRSWSDIDSRLPRREIRIYGPNVGSPEHALFLERVMTEGARQIDCLAELERRDPAAFVRAIMPRHDEVWLDAGDDPRTLQATLQYSRNAIGIFGWQRFQQLQGLDPLRLGGVDPTNRSINSGRYPLSQPVYLYAPPSSMAQPQVRRLVQQLTGPAEQPSVRTYGSQRQETAPVATAKSENGRRVRTYTLQE